MFTIYLCSKIKRATFSSPDGDLTLASDFVCSHNNILPPLLLQAQIFSLACLVGLCCCATLASYQVLSLKILLQLRWLVGRWKWEASCFLPPCSEPQVVKSYWHRGESICSLYTDRHQRQVQNGPEPELGSTHQRPIVRPGTLTMGGMVGA